MRIYVGNLPYTISDDDLKKHFEPFGQVQSASIIMDKQTGRSKGFGFIEMETKTEAEAAIENLNDKEFQGRKLVVNEARLRTEFPPDRGRGDRPHGGRGPSSRGGGGGNRDFGGGRSRGRF